MDQSSGAMPRCYMVKKGAPRDEADPQPCSPTEATVAPPSYRPPDEHSANTEPQQNGDTATEYAELRSALISERSAADTEAAHELLSLAAGVPPLPPATVLTVLQPPEPVPIYTYTIQPATTIFIVSDVAPEPEPMYQAVHSIPIQQVEFIDSPPGGFVTYPTNQHLPPMPPLEYHPPQPQEIAIVDNEPGRLTTVSIEECSSDSEPDFEPLPVNLADYSDMPPLRPRPAEPPILMRLEDSDDEEPLCIVTAKQKQGKHDCKECGKRYATSSNLSRHKQTHRSLDSKSAKKCDECGKAYVSMPALAMHVLTHRMGHVCGVCGKLFSRPWLLQGHLRSHTGEKPYNCAACGKAFADRSNLRAHLQTHSSDKKYECPRCKRSFALKSYLNKHQEAACMHGDEDDGSA